MEPMDPSTPGRPDAVVRERLVPSAAHLRSPVVDDHSIELLALDPDRLTLELPPLNDVVGMLLWSLGPGVPCLALVGWEAALITGGAGLFLWILNGRPSRSGVAFTEGFLRFRGDDAPAHGIQEEDDVRWRWRGGPVTGGREDGARPSWTGSINP
jgi:hypothetical protein